MPVRPGPAWQVLTALAAGGCGVREAQLPRRPPPPAPSADAPRSWRTAQTLVADGRPFFAFGFNYAGADLDAITRSAIAVQGRLADTSSGMAAAHRMGGNTLRIYLQLLDFIKRHDGRVEVAQAERSRTCAVCSTQLGGSACTWTSPAISSGSPGARRAGIITCRFEPDGSSRAASGAPSRGRQRHRPPSSLPADVRAGDRRGRAEVEHQAASERLTSSSTSSGMPGPQTRVPLPGSGSRT